MLGTTLFVDGSGGNYGENLGGDGAEDRRGKCRGNRRDNCVEFA